MGETIPLGERKIRSGKGAGGARFATKYSTDYADRMIEWFKERSDPVELMYNKHGNPMLVPKQVPTLSGFAASIGVTRKQLLLWKEEHRGFEAACNICMEIERYALETLGARVPTSAKYVLTILKEEFGLGTMDAGAEDLPVPTFGPIGSGAAPEDDEPEPEPEADDE